MGDLPTGIQSQLHAIIRTLINSSLSDLGLDPSTNIGPYAVSDTNGSVKPAPAPAGPEAALEGNAVAVHETLLAIEAIDSGLHDGGVPDRFDSREDALQARAGLVIALRGHLDVALTLLDQVSSGFHFDNDAAEDYETAARLVGGHAISDHAAVEPRRETIVELSEVYEEGEDFTVLDPYPSAPNCHTHTMIESGFPQDQIVVDPTEMLNQDFDVVDTIAVSEDTDAGTLDAQLREAGVQDGDVFAFTSTLASGEAIEHTGIIRIAEDGTIRFESVLGMREPLLETEPSVTLHAYSETSRGAISGITIYRKKDVT